MPPGWAWPSSTRLPTAVEFWPKGPRRTRGTRTGRRPRLWWSVPGVWPVSAARPAFRSPRPRCSFPCAIRGLAGRAEELGRGGALTLQVQADLSEIRNIARAIDQVVEAWGRIDALVNNAGREVTRPFLETTEADWDAMLTLNLRTVFFATQLVARAMIAGGVHGRIV